MTKLQEVFIENLKYARKEAKITQEALAEKVGATAKYIGAIEQGFKFPSIKMLEALALALDIPAYTLFISPTDVSGSAATEIIDNYNNFLEERLLRTLKESGQSFLYHSET
jgi:transcriptional regulator with XRE-family HTH domain